MVRSYIIDPLAYDHTLLIIRWGVIHRSGSVFRSGSGNAIRPASHTLLLKKPMNDGKKKSHAVFITSMVILFNIIVFFL